MGGRKRGLAIALVVVLAAALGRDAWGRDVPEPAAPAARKTPFERGRLLYQRGRFNEAARAYYAAYALSPKPEKATRAELMARLAMTYAAAGRRDIAGWWWEKGRRAFPRRTFAFKGCPMTWDEVGAALGHLVSPTEANLPRITLPLKNRFERRFTQRVTLLTALLEATPTSSYTHYFLYTSSGITAYEAARDEGAWPEPLACDHQPVLLHVSADRALFATPYRIFAVGIADGRRLWAYGARPPGVDDPDADPEDFPALRYHVLAGDRLVSVWGDGEAVCLNVTSGVALWKTKLDPRPRGPLAFDGYTLAYPARRAGWNIACALDAKEGRLRRIVDVSSDGVLQRVVTLPDDGLLAVSASGLIAFDLDTGHRRWRVSSGDPIAAGAVVVDRDGIYLSDQGLRVVKLRLNDGRAMWMASLPTLGGDERLRIVVHGGRVLVGGEETLAVFDAEDGQLLYTPDPLPDQPLIAVFFASGHIAGLGMSRPAENQPAVFYAYDFRTETAALRHDEEPIGKLKDYRGSVLCDDALILQDGRRMVGLSAKPN